MSAQAERTHTCLEDIFNDDVFGLLDMSDEEASLFVSADHYKSSTRNGYVAAEGELVAKQAVCHDFHLYEDSINSAIAFIGRGAFDKVAAQVSTIAVGSIFVFEGLVAIVVDINEAEERNSGQQYRAHVVYANGTESKLLFSTVVSKSHKPNSYLVRPN